MDFTPKIGLRTLKTALAIFLCLLILPNEPFFACITIVFCVQDTVSNSFKMAFVRGFGTIWGGFIGVIFLCINKSIPLMPIPHVIQRPLSYLFIGIGIIVIIHTLNLMNKPLCINIACIVFLAITTINAAKTPIHYTTNRIIETLLGVVIGLLVNLLITPPHKNKADDSI